MATRCLCLILLILVGCTPSSQEPSGPRPNVILIMTDDQGWGDLTVHGNGLIDTPNLDQLANESARFDRFYVSPVCAPTRASLMTGRYHLRTGTSWVTRGLETMRSEEVTLAEMFKDAGYTTAMFGKWHNGAHYPFNPKGQGFDYFLGFSAGHWNNYFDTVLENANREPVETSGFITDVLTFGALDFIEAYRTQPFFLYVSYNAPHSPFQVPDLYFDKYKERGLDDKTASVYGMVENIDDGVGRIMRRLRSLEIEDNTIVLFLTDNGPNGRRYNGDMRGTKGSVHEGGVRVPLFVKWPNQITPQAIAPLAAHIDIMPTLAELTGVRLPTENPLDGKSLAPLLLNDSTTWEDRTIFTHQARRGVLEPYPGSLRTPQYRLVRETDSWALFDMLADPRQTTDIAAEQSEVVAQLSSAYDAWFADVTKDGVAVPPTPLGYPEGQIVWLPAHEGHIQGSASYKGGMGWANDWVTNWANADVTVTWPVEVVETGRYEVGVLYTAKRSAVGTTVRIDIGDTRVEAAVSVAHDPPHLPSPDRVPRGEVYERQWVPLQLGTVELSRGTKDLVVSTPQLTGSEAFDLKAVRVARID